MCRVTMGHLMVTIGHLRVTVGHPRVTIGHFRATMGHLALLFLTHKSTGPNKNSCCQNLGSSLSNFNKAPEPHIKYKQRSSGDKENIIRLELLGSCLVKFYKAPELDIEHD